MLSFHRDLNETLRSGANLKVSPQSARRQIAIIERAKELGGFA